MDLTPQIRFISRAFMETKEYKELKKARSHYLKDNEFSEKVNELKGLKYDIYQAQLGAKKIDNKKKNDMLLRIDTLSKDPNLQQYLNIEVDFHNLVYNTFNKISQIVDSSLN